MRQLLLLAVFFCFIFGCAQKATDTTNYIPSQYLQVKDDLDTDDLFHPVVIKPDLFRLEQPGYLIGLEKVSRRTVGCAQWGTCANEADTPCLNSRTPHYSGGISTTNWLECRMGAPCGYQTNFKSIFPTHIAKYGRANEKPSLVYNAYGTQYTDQSECRMPEISEDPEKRDYSTLYKQGWDYIENELSEDFARLVHDEQATHIFLFSMGWNTPQWEALANFNDLQRNIVANAVNDKYMGTKFKPLFINITWPSYWRDKKIGPEDFPIIANDADEIGMMIANHIIQNVMGKATTAQGKPKIILVGHSLGALLVTRAADSGFFITDKPAKIDLVIGLEGAFSLRRFTDKWFEKYLWAFQSQVEHSFYTSSIHDGATQTPSRLGGYYIGSNHGYIKAQEGRLTANPEKLFNFLQLDETGTIAGPVPLNGHISLVDASEVIYKNIAGASAYGKAHSDIYNPEVGAFMWQVIKECTIDNQQ